MARTSVPYFKETARAEFAIMGGHAPAISTEESREAELMDYVLQRLHERRGSKVELGDKVEVKRREISE